MEKDSQEKQELTRSKNELLISNKRRIEDIIFNLSEDIKEYQRKLKALGQQNKNLEDLSKKIMSRLSENNYEIIQIILSKKKRSNDDLNIIKTFLSTMKYLSSMIKILDIDKILFSLSIYLKMEKKSKDSILFRFGNKGTKFYILLSGQVTILILKETFVKICFMKFLMHLIMLKILGEDEMVKKIIIANHQNKFHLDEKSFENMFQKIATMGNKTIEKKNKNKKKEEESEEEEEESEEESKEDIKDIKNIKKENNGEEQNENLTFKRHKTLQLNYLVSNFNGFLNSKNYRYVKTNFKNENIENYDLPIIKRFSSKTAVRNPRKSVIQSSNYQPNLPFFHKEEEIQEMISYYVNLKEAIGNIKKKKFSIVDYIEDTYIYSTYSKQIDENLYKDKEKYIIYKYHDIVQKNKGDTFGELALQHEDSKRTATIIANTDCILGYLSKSAYETCLSEIELKRRKNEVNFIMSFAIFDQMNWISFENKYFNFFKREFYSQHELIVRQGESIKKIFFIMDGQFEITASLSTGNIFKIIRQKRKEAFENYKVKLNKKKNKMRLTICNNKDIIGLSDCCYFEGKEEISFVNVVCISPKSIVFTLDKTILNGLKRKIPEIRDNLAEIINKREKVMVDRLISIFNIILNKRQLILNNLLGNNNQRNKSSKNSKRIALKNKIPNINNKKESNITMKEEMTLSGKKRIYSANYKEKRHFSKISYSKKQSVDETNFNYSPKIKSYFSSKDTLYKSKMNSEKLSIKQNFGTILIEKNSNINSNNNDQKIFLKSPLPIKMGNSKQNINKFYPPVNKMMQKKYGKVFNWMNDIISNISERKNSEFIEDENNRIQIKENIETERNDDEEEGKTNPNIIPLENSKNFFEDDSVNLINKEKKYIKYQKLEKNILINDKKELGQLSQNNINNKTNRSINKSSLNSIHEEDKINDNKNISSATKKKSKMKTISNESFLKQILGNRYRDQEDEFISYAERKIMKTIKDYNTNLIKLSKMKLKFKKKMKKK